MPVCCGAADARGDCYPLTGSPITRQVIRHDTFTRVPDPDRRDPRFIDAYNDCCQPFTWTKTTEQILAKASRRPSPEC